MSKTMLFWDRIIEDHEIPTLTKKPTYMQLFMFSAITWNRHLIHYNTEYARRDGLPDVAIHRALIGNYLAQLLSDWLGLNGKVAKVEWNVRATAVPGDTLICKGRILKKRIEGKNKIVECEIWVEKKGGEIIAPGRGEVIIFS
jgi:hydroxyacyl-ACP dehydratase HTD2-like protein with hotdog domain